MAPQWTHLVFSGGGFLGFSYAGALRFLKTEGLDHHIKHVSGTSVGSVFATLFALQVPIADMEEKMHSFWQQQHVIPLTDMLQIIRYYGITDSHIFLSFLDEYIGNQTFIDIVKRTGIDLVICATHVETLKPVYFSVERTPHVRVIDAIRASIAIPWIFKPVKIGDDHYVDGGVCKNVPLDCFDDADPSHVLVLHLMFERSPFPNPMGSPWAFTFGLMQEYILQGALSDATLKRYPYYILMENAPTPFFPIRLSSKDLVLSFTEKELDDAITYGYEVLHSKLFPQMYEDSPPSGLPQK